MATYKLNLKKIKDLSTQKGMSMSKLCESAGMNRSRATDWKHRGVYPKTIRHLADVLDIDPEELILEER